MSKNNKAWDYVENLYNETITSNQTFSDETIDMIQSELKKMQKQKEEWLKQKKENIKKDK